MKNVVIAASIGALVFGGMALVSAEKVSPSKPEKGMIVGHAIEMSTYAMKGLGGETILEAMKVRCEQGFPVGILEEETGEVWVATFRDPAPASHLETANDHLMELMGKKVAVQGMKYRAKGVNVIRMSLVSEY